MKSNILSIVPVAVAVLLCNGIMGQTVVPQLGKNSIAEVVAAMTLEEKAAIVIGGGRDAKPSVLTDGTMIGSSDFRIPGGAGVTNAIPRLGIPAMVLVDGPAGVRMNVKRKNDDHLYFATAFPSGTTLASTWNTELVQRVGEAFGNEVKEFGADIILAPGVNIHRNPLGGRNFEYYSEDPVITGNIAAAIITGLQSNGIGTSIKHFVANNQETSRSDINAVMDERTLREIYLRGFEIAVKKAKPWTVMSSYNLLDGVHTSERKDLLTTILRDEWKFEGYVMTDWGGKAVNLPDQMNAGNDMIMPGSAAQISRIVLAVKKDSISEQVLNRNVERILRIVVQSPSFLQYKYNNAPDMKAHARISREAAAEGAVLLENKKGVLPLADKYKSIALLGNTSYAIIAGGMGSGDVNRAYTVSLAKGLTNAGYVLNKELEERYRPYVSDYKNRPLELAMSDSLLAAAALGNDIALLTIGRNSGETKDRSLDSNYYLRPSELELIKRTATAFHKRGKKLVVVLNLCGVTDTRSWTQYADAVLLAWQPGQEGGDAIADVLSGKVNPSGKLATTFPQRYADVSSSGNFPGTPAGYPTEVKHEEGIYVGYRYHDAFKVDPAYAFGYGLSYTSFRISPLKLNSSIIKDKIIVSAVVTNTGKVAGKEVLQLYVTAPAGGVRKPVQELRAFAKTKLLQPGEAQEINLELDMRALASFNTGRHAWIADKGKYIFKAGTSSRNIVQSATATLEQEVIVEQVHSLLFRQSVAVIVPPGKR
ncbi:glycoside hydrolase family 3 N-terminal domain-containing protein [Filimonas effusa]|uniref:Beta-glucosidase n=1 Tax=Filimonas effusa TaxID=2508721 RepID=A0A4Q1D4M4_9BACT|nr:glycoside hydrolase family 3 N-terminal domain-containing protein [Filimonas effusa]RXK83400.1 beta-glucosidase [Filimonas effusa]